MSEITEAIKTRQTQIAQIQSDIDALQRAASVLRGKSTAAKPTSQPKAKRRRRGAAKTTQKRHVWSAAEKAAIGKRMKAYWAKRRAAKRGKKR